MKFYILFVAVFCAFLKSAVTAQEDCMAKAKNVKVNMTDCCKYPDIFDRKVINDTIDKVKKTTEAQLGTPLFDCLVEQTLFKDHKLADASGNFQNDKIKAYIGETVKDAAWKRVINAGYAKCVIESPKYADNYQQISGVKKEDCDFKYDALGDCVDIATFSECPNDSWTTNTTITDDCKYLKNFVKECYQNIAAINEFLDHQED